jgi:hypothetical protein
MAINFQPDMIAAIIAGQKIRTWRPVKPGEMVVQGLWGPNDTMLEGSTLSPEDALYSVRPIQKILLPSGRIKFAVERDYAIGQGRGKPALRIKGRMATIRLYRIEVKYPLQMDQVEARQEGFPGLKAFYDKLEALYGRSMLNDLGYSLLFRYER